jgi:hypothetical protein
MLVEGNQRQPLLLYEIHAEACELNNFKLSIDTDFAG